VKDSSTNSWDAIADDWTAHADTNDYKIFFLMPNTLALFRDLKNKKVLDLGCGEGSYSRALSSQGAIVTAVDGSPRLIEIARERAQVAGLSIECLARNANSLDGLQDNSFDYVLASMSLMDIEDYEGAISEIVRVLLPCGQLIMSILHPSFSGKKCGWRRDENNKLDHFAVDDYFKKETWQEYITDKFKKPVIFRHMPLQDFMSPLIAKGLRLTLFCEPEPTAEQISQSNRLARLSRIPYFLYMVWEK
jgi:ubiquinone/menaquinone biosynthesis C-methylase UbiE